MRASASAKETDHVFTERRIDYGVTTLAVRAELDHLAKLQIVREITGKRSDRLYVYDRCKLLQVGGEPLSKES